MNISKETQDFLNKKAEEYLTILFPSSYETIEDLEDNLNYYKNCYENPEHLKAIRELFNNAVKYFGSVFSLSINLNNDSV